MPINSQIWPITNFESDLSLKLPTNRAKEFSFSRGCVRAALSDLFGIPPLNIPLYAPPGKPPKLKNGLGSISLSHTKDVLFIGWSNMQIGIDIERRDRMFKPNAILKNNYFHDEEINLSKLLNEDMRRAKVLKLWLLKESAIKWHNGSILSDLSDWMINYDFTKAYNTRFNFSLNTLYCEYKSWSLGIAHNSKNIEINPIINNL